VGLAGKHGTVDIQFRRPPVDLLAFDPEDLERWSVLRRVPSPLRLRGQHGRTHQKRRRRGCSFQWLH